MDTPADTEATLVPADHHGAMTAAAGTPPVRPNLNHVAMRLCKGETMGETVTEVSRTRTERRSVGVPSLYGSTCAGAPIILLGKILNII